MAVVTWSAEVTTEGDDTLEAWAAAFGRSGEWLAPVGEVLRENVEQRFQTQSDPWGFPWARHSPVTTELRRREGKSGRILIKDRYLANSFHWALHGSGGASSVVIASGGPAAAYAAAQQFGNPSNKIFGKAAAPIPARAMLPLRPDGRLDVPADMVEEIRMTILDAWNEALKRYRSAPSG